MIDSHKRDRHIDRLSAIVRNRSLGDPFVANEKSRIQLQDFLLSVSLRPLRVRQRRSDMVPHRDCNSFGRRQLGLRRVNPCSHGVHKGTNLEYRLLVAIVPAILVGLFRTYPVYAFRCVKSLVQLAAWQIFRSLTF
jgi:hypothetical protein